ncbi:centrosomal protein of 295 kDa isoform X2 [Anolis carolinensis]|uniref:centrosomal protein of 295 kDa isoform X2 n=1 Tax=Anolis carolinensis TaxID=28377 RepID=UPI002F2B801B
MYLKMKRKVARPGRLRLSPNEEAQLLKEEHERRRKLRLQQVREQERNIALQIRQDVKQRRDEELHHLAEELKAEWQKAQEEKIKALEKLYLSSLRAIGEGHRQAKENEPDLEALAKQAEERRKRAEKRHVEALKEMKNQKERLLREQTQRTNARRHAVNVEKERAAKIASLPPPPPPPFENIDLKTAPTVKVCDADTFSVSHHHLFGPHVDREMDTEQPDARLLAEDEAKQIKGLQNNKERERRERLEKARLRGKHALKMVRLTQDREKLMKELEQMQVMDLARRRQIVAQMPPQLFEPGYRRVELKEERQRELECAFEDMYTGDRKMQGDLILHLDPQPLPTLSDRSQDDELELSQEPDSVSEGPSRPGDEIKDSEPSGSKVEKTSQPQSNLALKKLLNKIKNQKDHWISKEKPEAPSEIGSIESGTISNRERRLCESEPENEPKDAPVFETKELPETLDQTVVAGNVAQYHPQEEATKIKQETERQKQMEWIEQQKQQLILLQQIEEQKITLEADFLKTQMSHQEPKAERKAENNDQEPQAVEVNDTVLDVHQQPKVEQQAMKEGGLKSERDIEPQAACTSEEDNHMQLIRDYQQRLLEQNRMHRDSVEEARKQLHEYQTKLKQRYQSVSAALFGRADRFVQVKLVPQPSSHLHGFKVLQRVSLIADHPSKNTLVQKQAEVPLKRKSKEGVLDISRRGQIQPIGSPENQRSFQPTHQQKERLPTLNIPVTQPCELPKMQTSFAFKSQGASKGASIMTHPGQPFPADSTSPSSETPLPVVPHVPQIEEALPLSLKHQDMPTQNKTRTISDQMSPPPAQPNSSVPFAVTNEPERTQESLVLRKGSESLPVYSDIVQLRDRMLASSESIQAQQEHLKELQEQLDEQREALLSRQKVQEDLLMQKHAQLKQQMEQQQEALKEFLKRAEESSKCKETTQAQETNSSGLLTSLLKEVNNSSQQDVCSGDLNSFSQKEVVSQNDGSARKMEPFQNTWGKEQKWTLSKPPLAKVKLGFDLEQHELSVIPELDTPRSIRLSATGYRESLTEDIFPTSKFYQLEGNASPPDSHHEEADILRIIAGDKKETSGTSQDQLHGSWCEMEVMEVNALSDSVFSAHSQVDQDLLSYAVDIGRRADPDSSFRANSMVMLRTAWSPDSLNLQTSMQQVACSYFASSPVSPASIITNYNPDRNLESTEPCSAKDQPKHFNPPMEEKANDAWGTSISPLREQDDPSEALYSHLSVREELHSNERIQQIINKYTRDFTWSSLSNISSYDPAVGLDATEMERNFPNFHRELFQTLQPSPDFNISSSFSQCKASPNSKDLNKSSALSQSCELTASSLEDRSNSLSFLSTGKLSNILPTGQTDEEVEATMKDFQPGAEESFEPLLMESALSQHRQSASPQAFSLVPEYNFEVRKSVENRLYISPENIQYEQLGANEDDTNLRSSIEHFRSLSQVEDQTSFYQLVPDSDTAKNTVGRTESLNVGMCSREQSVGFMELPSTSSQGKYEAGIENVTKSENMEINLSWGSQQAEGEQHSPITDTVLGLAQEMDSKLSFGLTHNSELESEPRMFQSPDQSIGQVRDSDSCLSQSNVPVWEKLTGRGIMEEPDLTLISSNDISAAESDLELCIQTESGNEKSENLSNSDCIEVKSSPESRRFLPLTSEVDDSISTQSDQLSGTQSTQEECEEKTKPALVTTAPTSLQESFLRRKKDFIERSSKRVEKLKSRDKSSEKPQAKGPQQEKTQLQKPKEKLLRSGTAVSRLKKVEEVKVCSPDDRRSIEIQMHQRTSRLYNNLSEVKTRKEQIARQENYAKNRERAKEFQKRTLEKLRARKANAKT